MAAYVPFFAISRRELDRTFLNTSMPPGLSLISSNRVENLLAALAHEIVEKPLSTPFIAETVVTPSPAMARWVNLQLARCNGIAANIHYPLPAAWIWETARGWIDGLPDLDPLTLEIAAWKIFFLLPQLLERQEFAPVRRYLQEDPDGIKRWQLSVKIAGLFDRYQFYRPDRIRDWCKGKDAGWQSILWRELLQTVQSRHRIDVVDELLKILNSPSRIERLPERVSLFAISSLPALFVDVIHALAAQTRVWVYLHSPCEHYWADLTSKKTIARLRVHSPDKARYYESGNELLASWGRQGQALQDLLLSHDSLQSETIELYEEPERDCLLHQIQRGILGLDSEASLTGPDPSLQIHICHSPFRECQVLHDRLLAVLDEDPSLRPEDILVMIPEIGRYAPYIEAVFDKSENDIRPFIPWNLSDIAVSEEHPLIEVFLQLLLLPDSRFALSEVMAFLDSPELAQRFDLDRTASETVRELTREAHVRWGMDAGHKRTFKLPEFEENTWRQAGRRFIAGYAIGARDYWNGIAPIPVIEGEKAAIIGRFWLLLQTLFECREELLTERSGIEWQSYLNTLLDRFFAEQADESGRIQQIRDALDQLQQTTSDGRISRELVHHCLHQILGEKNRSGRYFSGGVTFCGMLPMRSLPFRVICLVGMNDQAFPRRDRAVEFDLMKQGWRAGDPCKGDEDRYLLLETLLCARQILYISYTGRDLRDNSVRQPSVLVQELLDFIDRNSLKSEAPATKVSDALSIVHPMQAFGPKNFRARRPAYDKHWHRIACALARPEAPSGTGHWPMFELPAPALESRRIELFRLHQFLRHPVRYFFNSRLKIRLEDQASIQDSESFALDALEKWNVKSIIAADFLQRKDRAAEQLKAQGVLPHGSLGPLSLARIHEESRALLKRLEEYRTLASESRNIDLVFPEDYCLAGKIRNFYPGKGLLHFTPSKFKGTRLLSLWLDHLCLSLAVPENQAPSRLFCRDQSWQFSPLEPGEASEMLWKILRQYLNALQKPPAILPEASYVCALYYSEGKISEALNQARTKWDGYPPGNRPGEKDDSYLGIALRDVGTHPVDDPEFARSSMEFYSDILKFAEEL
ncbi:MAG: exodeoxyribonuclease V subunit gamma [Methylococcales bacterium]